MNNLKKYFTWFIIIVLVIIILLERSCSSNNPIISEPTVKIDTIWKTKVDTITKNVIQTKVIHVKIPFDIKYQPSNNIDTCKTRFNNLLKNFITKKIYQDTIKMKGLGNIYITDTVFMNSLGKRIKILDYKIPTIEKTITKEKDPVKQLYIGGNLFGQPNKINLLTPGVLYKTKKDNIYQINLGINFDGSITYGFGMYYKIKL